MKTLLRFIGIPATQRNQTRAWQRVRMLSWLAFEACCLVLMAVACYAIFIMAFAL